MENSWWLTSLAVTRLIPLATCSMKRKADGVDSLARIQLGREFGHERCERSAGATHVARHHGLGVRVRLGEFRETSITRCGGG